MQAAQDHGARDDGATAEAGAAAEAGALPRAGAHGAATPSDGWRRRRRCRSRRRADDGRDCTGDVCEDVARLRREGRKVGEGAVCGDRNVGTADVAAAVSIGRPDPLAEKEQDRRCACVL